RAPGAELRGQWSAGYAHGALAVREELESAVGPIGLPGIGLRHLVRVGERGEERERLDVLVAVDRPLIAGLPVAAVVPHPDLPLGLGLLGAERQRIADHAIAQGLDLLGGLQELVPCLRGRCEAGLREKGLVVEEGTR